ncbi:hypothetical protein ACFUN7_14720 [Streptomyces sp. NPDC057236]|uniref:hypothetical protein n=1 Tax=Streptomyces sp. NPDC057236 TaxID=3346059 RepID=UPI0036373705
MREPPAHAAVSGLSGLFRDITDPRTAVLTRAVVGGTPAHRREFTQGDAPSGPEDVDDPAPPAPPTGPACSASVAPASPTTCAASQTATRPSNWST